MIESQTFTRQQLYDIVWTRSLLSLSKEFAISDVGLRKACIRMNIPLPPNGHWVRVQFGKKVKRIVLPIAKGEEHVITLKPRISEENTDDSARKDS